MDDAEEPDKTGESKAPSKFQSVGVQVEEEKWWVHMHLSSRLDIGKYGASIFLPSKHTKDNDIFH